MTCFVPTWPVRARFTLLDGCGAPRFGPCSQFVTGGFGQVQLATQIQEGEEFTAPRSDGSNCYSIKLPDTVQWDTLTFDMCNVDPEMWATLNDSFRILRDYRGGVSGWAEGYNLNSSNTVAVELWLNVGIQAAAICDDPGGGNIDGMWVHILSPATANWRRGDLTLSRTFSPWQLIGISRQGNRWGRGPYDVELNGPGMPGPLVDPVLSTDRITTRLVTIAPPEETCGCIPLSNPNAPALNVTEDTSDPSRMTAVATATLPEGTNWLIDWGDGSTPTVFTGSANHAYTEPGDYYVSIMDTANAQQFRAVKISVPWVMTMAATPLSGPPPLTVTATTAGETGAVNFAWGGN